MTWEMRLFKIQSNLDLLKWLVSTKLFTKSGFYTILKVTYQQFDHIMVSGKMATKSSIFTILKVNKSGFDCIVKFCFWMIVLSSSD